MKKIIAIFITLLILSTVCVAFNIFVPLNGEVQETSEYTRVQLKGKKFKAEVARTKKEQRRGLKYRETLCGKCGMLFVFEEEGRHSFWMKDINMPLDIIFMNSNREVVDIFHANPCKNTPCKRYTPRQKTKYVLEVNQNTFTNEAIGKKIQLPTSRTSDAEKVGRKLRIQRRFVGI